MEDIKQRFNDLRQNAVDEFNRYASLSDSPLKKERFDIMHEYYSFCVTLTNIISGIDALTLVASQEISNADKHNEYSETEKLYGFFKILVDFRKALEDFLKITEQYAKQETDVFVYQLNLQANLTMRRLLPLNIEL